MSKRRLPDELQKCDSYLSVCRQAAADFRGILRLGICPHGLPKSLPAFRAELFVVVVTPYPHSQGSRQDFRSLRPFPSPRCAGDVAFIDYATAAIHWVYRVLAEEERALVFRGYWGGGGGCAGCAYAPKAEVEVFCEEIDQGF